MADSDYYRDPYLQALVATQQFHQILTQPPLREAMDYARTAGNDIGDLETSQPTEPAEQEEREKRVAQLYIRKNNIAQLDIKDLKDQASTGLSIWATSWREMIKHDKQTDKLPAEYQKVIDSMQKKVRGQKMTTHDQWLVTKYNDNEPLLNKLQAYAYMGVPEKDRKDTAYQESYKVQQEGGHTSLRNRLLDGSEQRKGCIKIIKEILMYCYSSPIHYSTDSGEEMIAILRVQIAQCFDYRSQLTRYYSAADLIKASLVYKENEADRESHPYYNIYQRLEQHYQGKSKRPDTFEEYLDNRIKKHWHQIADDFYSIIGKYANDQEIISLQEKLKQIEHTAAMVNVIGLFLGVLCIAAGLLVYHQYFFPLVSAGGTLLLLAIGSIMVESLPYLSINDEYNQSLASTNVNKTRESPTASPPPMGVEMIKHNNKDEKADKRTYYM